MTSGNNSYRWGYERLLKQMPTVFEANQLFAHLTGTRWEQFRDKDQPMPPETMTQLEALLTRRQSGEPLQYLLGEWEFYGLPFLVGEGVLIPRPDTETLVDVALQLLEDIPSPQPEVLELCAGSGCVAVALKTHSSAQVTAVELSPLAFAYLEQNIALNHSGVIAAQGDLFTYQHPRPLDLIVSNPPYIPREELTTLQREVQWEPALALDGGVDGLDFYRFIVREFLAQLKPGGWLALEIGIGQEQHLFHLMERAGYQNLGCRKDLGGIVRVVWGQRTGTQT